MRTMKVSLNHCKSCGYQIFTAPEALNSPFEIKAAKKIAIREKMHFTIRVYTTCPQCEYVFIDTAAPEELSADEIQQRMIVIRRQSSIIKSLRTAIKNLRNSADHLDDASTSLVDGLSATDPKQIDLTLQLDELMIAVDYLFGLDASRMARGRLLAGVA